MEDDSIPDHKLCGFLSTVLTVTPTPNDPAELSRILPINTRCHIFGSSSGEVGFMTENNVTLSPINPNAEAIGTSSDSAATMTPETDETQDSHNFQNSGTNSTPYRKKKWSGIGMVNGSISVVHKLHALVMHKCLKINAIVLRNVFGDSGEVRVVVLVDVYLPIALWSGWQFPKSVSTAAALFRHLRCEVLEL